MAKATTDLELRGRGRDRRSRDQRPAVAAAAELHTTMMVSQGVPMLATETSLAVPSGVRTTCTPRTTSFPGSIGISMPTRRICCAFTSAAISRGLTWILRRRRFFAGDAKHGGRSELGDIWWFKPDASEMDEADWNSGFARSLMVFLNGDAIPELTPVGRPITDDHFLLLFNAHSEPIKFTMPAGEFGQDWLVRLDTATGQVDPPNVRPRARSTHRVGSHSMIVLSTTVVPEEERAASKSRALLATASAAKAPMHSLADGIESGSTRDSASRDPSWMKSSGSQTRVRRVGERWPISGCHWDYC